MSQQTFIETVVDRFGVESESDLPASQIVDLGPRREDEELCEKPMREAVGSLLWVSGMTRPDIVSAVRAEGRQTHNPSSRHWKAVVKIIAYLKRQKTWGYCL